MSASFSKGESRLHGIVAFVEPHVAPLLVRPIRFQFLQLCCLGARMVDRPLLPTASNLGTRLVVRPFLCNAAPPIFLIILKFLSQRLGIFLIILKFLSQRLGIAANGWRYLGPPLRHCCRLQACWSKGKGEATKNGATRYTDMPVGRCNLYSYVYDSKAIHMSS